MHDPVFCTWVRLFIIHVKEKPLSSWELQSLQRWHTGNWSRKIPRCQDWSLNQGWSARPSGTAIFTPPFIITTILIIIIIPAVIEHLLSYLKVLARNRIVHEDTFAKPDCGNFLLQNKTEALTIYELVSINNVCFCVYNFHVPKNREASTPLSSVECLPFGIVSFAWIVSFSSYLLKA